MEASFLTDTLCAVAERVYAAELRETGWVDLTGQLHGPTLNEDREQGSTLDRGGEGRGRWEFIEELGIMCSGQSLTQLFSIQWESKQ
ncbi:hypothetical protein PAMP_018440 [Pampus punctatissimus]